MLATKTEFPISPDQLDRFRTRTKSTNIGRDRCLVAVSGGPDSMGLLGLLQHELKLVSDQLVVCYVDHGIRPSTATDKAVIREFSESYGIPFRVSSVNVPKHMGEQHLSLE